MVEFDPAQRLLVLEQERLVAGVEVDRLERVRGVLIDPGGLHEVERVADPVRHLAVLLGLLAIGKAEGPGVDLVDVGIAAGREGAQQVERRCGLGIRLQHPRGIRGARLGREGNVVDDVTAIRGQFDASRDFGRRRTRLGELARHAADLHHRHLGRVGQDHGHLQQYLEGISNVVRCELGEAFGAVASLQQERLAP